jgi:hypothetical protein
MIMLEVLFHNITILLSANMFQDSFGEANHVANSYDQMLHLTPTTIDERNNLLKKHILLYFIHVERLLTTNIYILSVSNS